MKYLLIILFSFIGIGSKAQTIVADTLQMGDTLKVEIGVVEKGIDKAMPFKMIAYAVMKHSYFPSSERTVDHFITEDKTKRLDSKYYISYLFFIP